MYRHRSKSKFTSTGANLLSSTSTLNAKPFDFRSKTHKNLLPKKSKTDYSKYSYHHHEKEIEQDLNNLNLRLSKKFDPDQHAGVANADEWNFEEKKTNGGYNFFDGSNKNSGNGFLNKFNKGLSKEKNIHKRENFSDKKRRKEKHRGRNRSKNPKNKFEELEEEEVGKKDYKKNMNLELEAQDAEFEKLIECRQCGRSFGRAGYKKHSKVCKKVFKKKKDNGKGDKAVKAKFEMKKNWKKQSEALRDMIKANRKGGKGGKKVAKGAKEKGKKASTNKYDEFLQDGRKECPLCKKLFSEQGLIRHTPLCKSKQNFNGKKGRYGRRR